MSNFYDQLLNDPEKLVNKCIKAPFGISGILKIVSINKINDKESKFNIGVVDTETSKYINIELNENIINQIELISDFSFTGDPEKFFMYIMGNAIRSNLNQDPLFAVGSSKIDPLPHQLEAVYKYILPRPRIRFMIADEPGAGKTIMAGLTIKELLIRGEIKRVLVVVPGSLTNQWKSELKNRFNEDFSIIDSEILHKFGDNSWNKFDKIITSMDFAKNEVQIKRKKGKKNIRNSLLGVQWDLVVVDEAHKMNAEWDLKKMVMKDTQRYKLGYRLSDNTEHFLFLTATPHKGKSDSFRLLLRLLEPDAFDETTVDISPILESYLNEGFPMFIRRLKEEMVSADNKQLFPLREAHTISFKLSSVETVLYNQVTDYVKKIFNLAKEIGGKRSTSIGFMLKLLQRRLNSSVRAIRLTLINRKNKLVEILKNPDFDKSLKELRDRIEKLSLDALEAELNDDISPKKVNEMYNEISCLTMATNRTELEKEIDTLNTLISSAEEAENQLIESKLTAVLEEINKNLGQQQLIIFTEYKDTLDYLKERIPPEFHTDSIHGGMTQIQRKEVQDKFWNKDIDILLCTDAASEGINLQCCWNLFNYDIPWNPNRLEQRMGRIHRYLQDYKCHFFNLVATEDSDGNPIVEGQVLKKIFDKLDKMREDLGGTDRVFDVIGGMFEGVDFEELLIQSLSEEKIDFDSIIDNKSIEANKLLEVKSNVDIGLEFFIKQRQKSEDNRLWPKYISEFVRMGYWYAESPVNFDGNEPYRVSIPLLIRNQIKRNDKKYGTITSRNLNIVFNKPSERQIINQTSQLEYITAGHPLLESIIDLSIRMGKESIQKGTILLDPSHGMHGLLWFLKISFKDGNTTKDILSKVIVLYTPFSDIEKTDLNKINYNHLSSLILWDLRRDFSSASKINIKEYKKFYDTYKKHIVEVIGARLCREEEEELKKTREKAKKLKNIALDRKEIRERAKIQDEISKFLDKEMDGEDVTSKIKEKELERDNIGEKILDLRKKVEKDCEIVREISQLISVAIVVPAFSDGTPARSSEEIKNLIDTHKIDMAAMKAVFEYEKKRGWITEDKSKIKCGYDIESVNPVNPTDIRHIEVKGHEEEEDVFISKNEWMKAQNDIPGRYWLYIVNDALSEPKVQLIEDPASKFDPQILITERYKVSIKHIKNLK